MGAAADKLQTKQQPWALDGPGRPASGSPQPHLTSRGDAWPGAFKGSGRFKGSEVSAGVQESSPEGDHEVNLTLWDREQTDLTVGKANLQGPTSSTQLLGRPFNLKGDLVTRRARTIYSSRW